MKRAVSFLLIVIMALCLFSGCNENEKSEAVTLVDQLTREVTLEKIPERIVSGYYISSSALIALGLEEKLVGIETGSNKRPIYAKAAEELLSSAYDVGSAKSFDVEACLSAEPDLVILPKKAKDYAETLSTVGIPVIIVDPESQKSLEQMIELLGKATGTEENADKLIRYYNEEKVVLDFLMSGVERENVMFCNPGNYLSIAPNGMYQSDLIEKSGGRNAFSDIEGTSWVNVSYEQIALANPDVIIVPTNSNANGTPDYLEELLNDPALSGINAIKNKRVYIMPSGYESWDSPVPSGILGAFWLVSVLHPELFSSENLAKEVNYFYETFYGFDAAFGE